MTVHLACLVADAFTESYDEDRPLHDLLRRTFGTRQYRWYCVDQSNVVYGVTFSDAPSPGILTFHNVPAAVVQSDRQPFALYLFEADLVRPGNFSPQMKHPAFVNTL